MSAILARITPDDLNRLRAEVERRAARRAAEVSEQEREEQERQAYEAGGDARRQQLGIPTERFRRTAKQQEQWDAVNGPARHVLAYGGSRSGKTFGFCEIVAGRALAAPGSRHLIARLHNIDVRQSVMLDTWPKMMKEAYPDVDYDINKADQFAKLSDGSEVWFGGLDDKDRIEKILGKEYATIYPNETSQIVFQTILILRTRLAQACFLRNGDRLPLKMLYDLNPTGRGHWTYREFIEKVRPDNGMPIAADSRAWVMMNPSDNPHLPPEYHEELDGLPDRQRQRFRDGKYLSEVPGSLWSIADRTSEDGRVIPGIETLRRADHPPLARVVIGVDPSGSDGTGGDLQGIVVVGLGTDGSGYVLADRSCRLSPEGWARVVAKTAREFGADRVVAERNFGGAMVESVIRAADANIPVTLVTASRGKIVRAEPVAALYERGIVHHVGNFPDLEEQLGMTTTSGYQGGGSPDRMDALVWACSELMLGGGYDYGSALANAL
jgi:phage terminase large subunit-like protein